MKIKKMVESFNYAINGIIETVRTQRNMKIHIFAALCVLLSCFLFDVSKIEFLILAITITLVLGAEIINTAIEATIDMSTNHYHPLAKIAKNASAGAVLVTAINALLVGYIIFWDKISDLSYDVIHKVKQSEPYMIFIALVFVILATLIIKSIFGEGTPLRGGMPSGHSALSFSIATAISLITEEPICIVLSYLMALITAQSRVDSNIHSIWEVIVGALFGTLLTLLIFVIFKI
ncbi:MULTISPECIES: diacylglycerol kinase [unclassified Clostridium]|uniref:diacylglycerol kinase n=1 Tax=unclassified Clostridium TaxID=2614128 RepID=UPI001899751F|nr:MULTISPECIES: diacylglycerol kinase [unclassified Clostridium]MCR1952512.1 diacylglycerol kinase [Clostridium sp. DSM 100503]